MKNISLELEFFLSSIICGVILLVIYDLLRIFRRIISHNGIVRAIEDILFWIVSAFLIFHMMYIRNNGIIRAFAIIGMLSGMVVYNQTVSTLFVNTLTKLIHFIIRTIRKIIRILSRPLAFILKRIQWFIQFLFKKFRKIGKYVMRGLQSAGKKVKMLIIKK